MDYCLYGLARGRLSKSDCNNILPCLDTLRKEDCYQLENYSSTNIMKIRKGQIIGVDLPIEKAWLAIVKGHIHEYLEPLIIHGAVRSGSGICQKSPPGVKI